MERLSVKSGSVVQRRARYRPGVLCVFRLTSDWNLITRTIVPLIDQPTLAPGLGNVGGLGDVQLSLYMSPVRPFGGLIWGLGPSFSFATASDRSLGSGKNSAGLSTALLTIKGPWL